MDCSQHSNLLVVSNASYEHYFDSERLSTPLSLSVPACNRTYYGTVGRTYSLELHRPKEDRMPFLCHLTFTAGGGELGDLVQVRVTVAQWARNR